MVLEEEVGIADNFFARVIFDRMLEGHERIFVTPGRASHHVVSDEDHLFTLEFTGKSLVVPLRRGSRAVAASPLIPRARTRDSSDKKYGSWRRFFDLTHHLPQRFVAHLTLFMLWPFDFAQMFAFNVIVRRRHLGQGFFYIVIRRVRTLRLPGLGHFTAAVF